MQIRLAKGNIYLSHPICGGHRIARSGERGRPSSGTADDEGLISDSNSTSRPAAIQRPQQGGTSSQDKTPQLKALNPERFISVSGHRHKHPDKLPLSGLQPFLLALLNSILSHSPGEAGAAGAGPAGSRPAGQPLLRLRGPGPETTRLYSYFLSSGQVADFPSVEPPWPSG